jgi:hypothetical protein
MQARIGTIAIYVAEEFGFALRFFAPTREHSLHV